MCCRSVKRANPFPVIVVVIVVVVALVRFLCRRRLLDPRTPARLVLLGALDGAAVPLEVVVAAAVDGNDCSRWRCRPSSDRASSLAPSPVAKEDVGDGELASTRSVAAFLGTNKRAGCYLTRRRSIATALAQVDLKYSICNIVHHCRSDVAAQQPPPVHAGAWPPRPRHSSLQ